MRPLLELMEDVRGLKYERRDAATAEEARYYLQKWSQKGYQTSQPICVLAFHGMPGQIELGKGHLTLEELGDILEGKCKDRYIHFDSCHVLDIEPQRIRDFRKQTLAKVVSGYRHEVNWIESAAFTLHVLDAIADGEPMAASLKTMWERHKTAGQQLGFRAVWATGQIGIKGKKV